MTRQDTRQRPYRLLIFDWDGTLRDSIATIVGCAVAAAAEHGLQASPDAVQATVGLGLDEAIGRWFPEAAAPPEEPQRVLVRDSYSRLWIEGWGARADLFPGVEQCLRSLHGEGYWMAIATGKSRRGLDRDFTQGGARRVSELFLASRTADETTPKPSPAMVHEILEELGVEAREALVVGDSQHDLEMAANAGCDAVGVEGGALTAEQLWRFGPRVVLPGVGHLGAWLTRL